MHTPSPIPAVYRFLPGVEPNRTTESKTPLIYDLALVLDCGDLDQNRRRTSSMRSTGYRFVINIDHHVSNTGFGHIQFVDTDACATAEIVYRLINALEIPF